MVHKEKVLFISLCFLKKYQGIYFGGQRSFLGFKYEPKVSAFLELQGEAKDRVIELANQYITTFQLLKLPFLTGMRFFCTVYAALRIYCSIP